MLEFPNKIMFVGLDRLHAALPILLKHIKVDPKHITIMDFEPNDLALQPWIEQGVTFVKDRVTPQNLGTLLDWHLSPGDLLNSWQIDFLGEEYNNVGRNSKRYLVGSRPHLA